MGIMERLVGGDSTDKYAELSNDNLQTPPGDATEVRFVDVRSQNDLINAKEELHAGNIVFANVAYIESNGMSLDSVTSELNTAVTEVDGDIVHKKGNDTIVAVPRDVQINREKL